MRNALLMSLADVAQLVQYGYTASASDTDIGPKFLRITDIVPPQIDWDRVPHCEIDEKDLSKFSLAQNDIVIARTGATVGYAKLIRDQKPSVFASYLVRIRVDPDKADPCYVGRIVESDVYKRFVLSRVGGAAQPNANAKVLASFRLLIPERHVQARIVSILSAYDDLIKNNRRRIALLEEAARLLYREWFVHFRFPAHEHIKITNGLPEGWERRTLGDVVEVVRESVRPSDFDEHDIHIGLEHIPRRSFTLADWEPAEGLASGKWRFEEGDILFCKIRPYFHKVGFTMRRGLVSSDALVWRVHDEADWPVVLCATSSDHFVAVASKTVREGSKMPRADWKVLREYVIPEPPSGLLDVFNDTVRTIAVQCKTLALQNKALAQARDLLLPRLMNGEITV